VLVQVADEVLGELAEQGTIMQASAFIEQPKTIFSLSSGMGRAGVAVIRISGPDAGAALVGLAGRLPSPRLATLMRLRDADGGALDKALVLYFPEGASFTGEETAELHIHGGRAVIQAVLGALGRMRGLRHAEPGEFTRRAFANGRLDLPQVEALGSLIDADTERQRRQALHGLSGALGQSAADWRELLLEAKAIVAAAIDFADEGDVGESAIAGIRAPLDRLATGLRAALAAAENGRIVAEGFRVALIGAPNAGKSTLLNRLAGSEIAIVTEHAGTTRDVLEARLDIDGYAVILMDTAGLRDTADPVERIGVERARHAAAAADLVLLLDDGASGPIVVLGSAGGLIRVRTKSDLLGDCSSDCDIAISSRTGEGIDSLLKLLSARLSAIDASEPAIITHARQRASAEVALGHVLKAAECSFEAIEFLAEHLNDAERALAELLGVIGVEETLGAVFSRFCIGK